MTSSLSRYQVFFFCQVQVLWTVQTLFQDQWLDYYYLNCLNLNTDTLGIIYAFSACLNFILAPIIAHWSDGQIAQKAHDPIRSRSGILLIVASIMGASGLMLVWIPISSSDSVGQIVWLSVWYTLNNIATTVFLTNWQAMSFGIVSDSRHRTKLFGWNSAVGSATEIVTSYGFGWLPMEQFNLFNIICCIATTLSFWVAIFYLRPPKSIPVLEEELLTEDSLCPSPSLQTQVPEFEVEMGIVPSLMRVFRNPPFRIFFVSYLLCNIYLMAPRDTILLQYGFGASQSQIALTNSLSQVVCLIATPAIVILSRVSRIGNRGAYILLVGGWATLVMSCVLFVSSPYQPLYWILVLGDAMFGGLQGMISNSLLADIVDYDQLRWRTRTSKATLYNSIIGDASGWDSIVDSLSYGFLSLIGFRSGSDAETTPNSASVIQGLKWMCFFSALPGTLSCLVMLKYPITQAVHDAILAILPNRLGGDPVHDPITGEELPLVIDQSVEKVDQQQIRDHFTMWELTQFITLGHNRLHLIIAGYLTLCSLILGGIITILCVVGLGETILLGGLLCLASLSIVLILLHGIRFGKVKAIRFDSHQVINEIIIT
jgi:Na+/melibiose symporter-like transporter